MKRRVLVVGLTIASVILSACSDETIVIATAPSADGGGSSSRCLVSSDCGPELFCEKTACGDPAGTCTPFPAHCHGDDAPVCGCDGVTYFNDCLRRAAGIAAASGSECGSNVAFCGAPGDPACPEGATCARLLGFTRDPKACAAGARGRCWTLPAKCPPPSGDDRWNACTGDGPGATCVDTCNAIRSSAPFVRASRCD